MQAWYLLYCKRGQLQRAQEHLERQSVNCLMPTIALEKIIRGKRTMNPNRCSELPVTGWVRSVIHTTTISATARCLHALALHYRPSGGHPSALSTIGRRHHH